MPNVSDAHSDGESVDVPPDAGPQDCASLLRLDTDFRLSEDGLAIHPAAAFDGDSLWLTYTIREGETSNFDIVLRRVGCDGRAGPPIVVHDIEGESDLDSDIAISGERLLVGYQSDDGSDESSAIRPFVRPFDLSGAAISGAQPVARERQGETIMATNWMVRVASRPGGFWVAGTWGVEEVSGFRAYAARVDLDGMQLAPAMDVAPTDQMESQTNLAIGEGETPYFAWTNFGDASLVSSAPLGGTVTPFASGSITEDLPALSGELLALHTGGGARLRIQVRNLVTGAEASIGGISDANAYSDIAGTPDAFAIVWLRQISGTRNNIFVASGRETGRRDDLERAHADRHQRRRLALPALHRRPRRRPLLRRLDPVVTSPDFEVHGRIVEF